MQTACLQTPVPRDSDLSVIAARIVKLSAVNSARSIGTPNRKYIGTAQRGDILGIRFSVDIYEVADHLEPLNRQKPYLIQAIRDYTK